MPETPAAEYDNVLTANVRQARIARVYADALLGAAARESQADEVGAELDSLVRDVIGQNPGVATFLTSPALTRRTREPVLQAAIAGNASPLISSFLGVLNANNRLDLLRPIAAAFRELLDKRAGRVRVSVRSAVPLGDAERDEIRQTLVSALGKEPVLDVKVDPALLGGLVVQVGDKVYDRSVKSRLDALRNNLLARGINVAKA